jgi:hypothetical protein
MAVGQVDDTIYRTWASVTPEIRADAVQTAERLLSEQAKALESRGRTDLITPPFDVIQISPGGLAWKRRKEAWAAIEG